MAVLVWATEIPVRPEKTLGDLFEVGQRWVLGSPHTKFSLATFPGAPEDGEVEAAAGGDSVTLALGSRDGTESIAGLRYVQSEQDGLVWSTELVGAHQGESFLVSIRVDCEAASWLRGLPPPRKPVIVRLVLEQLGGGVDGDLEVTEAPLLLEPAEMDLAVRAMRGELGNTLPIVYVSAGDRSTHLVSPGLAAREWSGLAHVLVEPNRAFSFRLRDGAAGKNAYAGAIGIYWPDGAGRRVLLPSDRLATPELAVREVSEELRVALTHRRPTPLCTWDHLQEVIAHARYTRLREAGSKELDEYVKYVDGELRAKAAELDRAEAEIRRLKAEVRRLDSIVDDTTGGLLSSGVERDFFQGERLGIVLESLREARARFDENSRPAHVVDDLLSANAQPAGAEDLRHRIRELLKDYRSMGARTRAQLEDIGFELSEDGPHIKLVFLGDPRYTFIAPKTGGDHRGGRNLASEINRTLFSR